jgi:DNA repair exonuclease SbcCD ATPase subunit
MMLRHNDSGSQSMLRASTESSKLWFIFGKTHQTTMDLSDTLPDDIDALRTLLLAERASRAAIVAERDKLVVRNERLEAIISEIRRAYFGRKSERITDDQLSLALEELETSLAKAEAEEEKADPALKTAATKKRRASRNDNLDHLPHEEVVIEPKSKACPCCGDELHVIGEDTSKRLDKVPAKVRVIVTGGRNMPAGAVRRPAPTRSPA